MRVEVLLNTKKMSDEYIEIEKDECECPCPKPNNRRNKNMKGARGREDYGLNDSAPSPPRMMAFINEKNRSAYSSGGTGLILCRSAFMPFQ